MALIQILSKKLFSKRNKKHDTKKFYEPFQQISHDLKNNFVAIRACMGNIKQCVNNTNVENKNININKALDGIDKKIIHSITLLNMLHVFFSPSCYWPNDTSTLSIQDCINQTIQNFPFASSKHAAFITIITPTTDFTFLGNAHLIRSIFFCLIKNAMHAIYKQNCSLINIEIETKSKTKNLVHFKFKDYKEINNCLMEYNLFEIGTPENHKNGIKVIEEIMQKTLGKADFKRQPGNNMIITLHFSSA